MKNMTTLLIGIIFYVNANAQIPQLSWEKLFNGKSASTDTSSIIKIYENDMSIYVAGASDAYGTANDILLIKRDYKTGDTLWTRHYNGTANGDDQVVDMEINQTTGDIYITGKSQWSGTGYDIVIIKYSANGDLGWATRWNNSAFNGDDFPKDIGIDGSGRVLISGYTYNKSGYYPYGDKNFLILSYNSNGLLLNSWLSSLLAYNSSVNNSTDMIGGAIVNSGQIFIAGEAMHGTVNNGYSRVFMCGLNTSNLGNPLTVNYYTCPENTYCGYENIIPTTFPLSSISTPDDLNFFNSMDVDNSNNAYLAFLYDTIYQNGTYYKIGIGKLNSNGRIVWNNKIGGQKKYTDLKVNCLKIDPNNLNVYAAGFEKNANGNFDWFIIKYNSSGVFQWRVNKNGSGNGNDIAYDIAFDEFQNPIVVGFTKNINTNNDITFVKYNKTNGNELFSVNYDSGNGDERAYNIIVDSNQKIIINGIVNTQSQSQNIITLSYCSQVETPIVSLNGNSLHSNAAYGNQWYDKTGAINGATSQNYIPAKSGEYYVIVSLNGCTSNLSNKVNFILTGTENLESANSIKLYPNPVTNELIIEIAGNLTQKNFEIINSVGQSIFNGTMLEKTVIQTSGFTPGVYLIKLESGKNFEFKKVIKN
jgi:hypothetical protein